MWQGVKYCFQNDAVDHIIRRFGKSGNRRTLRSDEFGFALQRGKVVRVVVE